jgi:hypothetical protein
MHNVHHSRRAGIHEVDDLPQKCSGRRMVAAAGKVCWAPCPRREAEHHRRYGPPGGGVGRSVVAAAAVGMARLDTLLGEDEA